MPKIKDMEERRKAFRGRLIEAANTETTGLSIRMSDIDGIEKVAQAYVNDKMLLRVNRRIANEMVKGNSKWPEETTLSRKGFRANESAILNTVYYAPVVEQMHERNRRKGYKVPTSFPERPAASFVRRRWGRLAQEDIRRTIRRRGR